MEKILAYHCGPALAGIKVANIVSIYKSKVENAAAEIERLNRAMNKKDIFFKILCECKERAMIIVYRKSLMEKQLGDDSVKQFLKKYGYGESGDIEEYLEILKKRLELEDFPHEIGVFLGYPLCDIEGFIERKNDYVFSGEWKVYENADEALKLFERFEKCRCGILRRLERGQSLEKVFCCA